MTSIHLLQPGKVRSVHRREVSILERTGEVSVLREVPVLGGARIREGSVLERGPN